MERDSRRIVEDALDLKGCCAPLVDNGITQIMKRLLARTHRGGGSFASVIIAVAMGSVDLDGAAGQIVYRSGQGIAPAFEGWEKNPDGSFDMVFGYFNRNLEEVLDIPVGPNNNIEPGGPDQGQPTHFQPRRSRFVCRVKVPRDFGSRELVWTLTIRGRTERAYATLKPEYAIDDVFIMKENGDVGVHDPKERENKTPLLTLEGDAHRSAKVGAPLTLAAFASDDGIPEPKAASRTRPGRNNALGLRVSWFVYRGPGKNVVFEPRQFKDYQDYRNPESPWSPGWMPPPLPADGRFPVNVTFNSPGTFVLRVMAHDGGVFSTQDVTVTVTP